MSFRRQPMLHIHNGDSTAETLKAFGLAGEHLPWRESYVCGPTPSGLSEVDFLKVRAEFLADGYSSSTEECLEELYSQQKALERFDQHEEVVLWFEHDIHCQTALIRLLHWFSHRDLSGTDLSLICIDQFPGKPNFRGLGELTGDELGSLFPGRQRVTPDQLKAGAGAWRAYCSSDPGPLESLAFESNSMLPFLSDAFAAHLQRFPSTKNGLGKVQHETLRLLEEGETAFRDLYKKFSELDVVLAGMGDAGFWLELDPLVTARDPLIIRDRSGDESLRITNVGRQVMNGASDFVALNGIDRWLGGVHLKGSEAAWRWNSEAGRLIHR